jgi:hypothetical protein
MSFREKSAWITLIAILFVSAFYFLHAPTPFNRVAPGLWELHVLALAITLFIGIEVIAYIVLFLRYPKDARTPKDEREQLIDLKATRLAAYVFVLGTFLSILTPYHGANGFAVGMYVVFAFAIAEIVNYAARIIYYRRGV